MPHGSGVYDMYRRQSKHIIEIIFWKVVGLVGRLRKEK